MATRFWYHGSLSSLYHGHEPQHAYVIDVDSQHPRRTSNRSQAYRNIRATCFQVLCNRSEIVVAGVFYDWLQGQLPPGTRRSRNEMRLCETKHEAFDPVIVAVPRVRLHGERVGLLGRIRWGKGNAGSGELVKGRSC